MSRKKIATLELEEDATVRDISLIIDNRLECFNDDVQCISNEDGTYDVIRTDVE